MVDVSQISNITGSPSTAISCLYLNKIKISLSNIYLIFYPTKSAEKIAEKSAEKSAEKKCRKTRNSV